MRGWLKSKTICQYLSYDKTELPLATFTKMKNSLFNNLK